MPPPLQCISVLRWLSPYILSVKFAPPHTEELKIDLLCLFAPHCARRRRLAGGRRGPAPKTAGMAATLPVGGPAHQQPSREGTPHDSAHSAACVVSVSADSSAHGGKHGREEAAWPHSQLTYADEAHSTMDGAPQQEVQPNGSAVAPAQAGSKPGAEPVWRGASVQIENGDQEVERTWAVYFSSLPKKLRGGSCRLPPSRPSRPQLPSAP